MFFIKISEMVIFPSVRNLSVNYAIFRKKHIINLFEVCNAGKVQQQKINGSSAQTLFKLYKAVKMTRGNIFQIFGWILENLGPAPH